MNLPQARSSKLVVQDLGKELLVYDLLTNQACTLNETSMIVFNACDGVTRFADLKRAFKFTDDLIYLTLDELNKHGLLENYEINHFPGLSRREVIRKVGLASMIALPVIASLVAPTAAMAASTLGANCQLCMINADCASGKCLTNALGGGKICAVASNSGNTYPVGTTFGAAPDQCTDIVGPGYCCSGSASKASGVCTCLAV